MKTEAIEALFTQEALQALFPKERANEFFDALFGDANEGSFDIELGFRSATSDLLVMELVLIERPGHCLACNLTYGLPQVFSRHPIINVKGLVEEIDQLLGAETSCPDWSLGHTEQRSRTIHVIPIKINLAQA